METTFVGESAWAAALEFALESASELLASVFALAACFLWIFYRSLWASWLPRLSPIAWMWKNPARQHSDSSFTLLKLDLELWLL